MKKQNKMKIDTKALQTEKDRRPYTKLGLYRDINLSTIDGRTKLGKTISGLKRELRDYVGVSTLATDLLIHRIVYKTVKLTLYEASNLQDLKHGECDHYLPMANSLRLDLTALAQLAQRPQKGPDLNEYIQERYGNAKQNRK